MRRSFSANDNRIYVWLRRRVLNLRRQVHSRKPSRNLIQTFCTLVADCQYARIRQFVENPDIIHTPVAAPNNGDSQRFRAFQMFLASEWKQCGVHSAPLLDTTAGTVRQRILRSCQRDVF